MRILAFGIVMGLCAATVAADAQRPAGPYWEVAARLYYPDGRSPAALQWPNPQARMAPIERDFWTVQSLCVFLPPDNASRQPLYGWHVKVTPVRESAAEAVVRVDWRRTHDKGKTVETPADSVELTLRPGNPRIPLDYILPDRTSPGACSAVGMALEIRLAR